MKRRVLPMLLAATMVAGLAAGCAQSGGNNTTTTAANNGTTQGNNEATTAAPAKDYELDSLTVMVDGTLVATTEEGQAQFVEELQKLTGIKNITIVQPDHSSYYSVVTAKMADKTQRPDVILLSSTYYASYAASGLLWDMTDAYSGSGLESRHNEKGSAQFVDAVRIDGKLYGMPCQKGGGCVTYVRQSWLDAAGITADSITDFDSYYNMLKKFKELGLSKNEGNDYVIGAAGYIGTEAPYINYWPEFYQDAYPTFVQDANGVWSDGFTADSMKAALERLRQGVVDGLIDIQSLDQKTSDARTKFGSGEYGAFTYWANHWAANLTNTVSKGCAEGEDPTLAILAPISEAGSYVNRLSNVWCVVDDGDGDNSREQAIYEKFIETMQDGADCQFLWTYGVNGVHYSTAAGTVLAGTEKEKTYEDGQFHWLEMISDNSKLYSKMHITPIDALVTLAGDPLSIADETKNASAVFAANSKNEALIPNTDVYAEYNGTLTALKAEIVAKVVKGDMTIEEAYKYFESESGKAMSDAIVESLNALNK